MSTVCSRQVIMDTHGLLVPTPLPARRWEHIRATRLCPSVGRVTRLLPAWQWGRRRVIPYWLLVPAPLCRASY